VLDTTTSPPTVTATITVGVHPGGIAITPDGSKVYVANFGGGSAGWVSVISTASNTVTKSITSPFLDPNLIAITPDGTKAYVSDFSSYFVRVIDTSTDTVTASAPAGLEPQGVAVTPDGKHVYFANAYPYPSSVSVIDTSTNTVTAGPIPVANYPIGVAISPDGSTAYVADFLAASVSVIDTASNTVGTPITVGSGPVIPAVTPDGSKVFVGNQYSSTVSVINTATHAVATITDASFNGPYGITIQPGQTLTPAQMVAALIALVQGMNISQLGTSLTDQLQQVETDINTQNGLACQDLALFASHVKAQTGKKITTAQANQILAAVASIEAALKCGA
jgi:YVTN family beta-propeller protein